MFTVPVWSFFTSTTESPITYANVWISYTNFPINAADHGSGMLSNGDVLFISNYTADVYCSNTSGSNWTQKADYPLTVNQGARGKKLDNNSILVVGGAGATAFANCYRFDVGANTWTRVASLPVGLVQPAIATLANGSIVVAGGVSNVTSWAALTSCYRYDPGANTWTTIAPLTYGLRGAGAGTLTNGCIIVFGGWDEGYTYTGYAYRYDPVANTWTAIANYPGSGYGDVGSATLVNGCIIGIGGTNSTDGYSTAVNCYNPSSNSWTALNSYPVGLYGINAERLGNGAIMCVGGVGSGDAQTSVYVFPTDSGEHIYNEDWVRYGNCPFAIHDSVVANTANGEIFFRNNNGCYRSNTSGNNWVQVASYPITLYTAVSGCSLTNGSVVCVGGWDGSGFSANAYRYDPGANSWTQIASYPYIIAQGSLSLLGNGSILYVGGANTTATWAPLPDCYRYDPGANTWTQVASIPGGRRLGVGISLGNGSILHVGGFDTGYSSSPNCYVYQPDANSWVKVANLTYVMVMPSYAPLANGSALVLGGCDYAGVGYTSNCYVYQTEANTWTQVNNHPMSTIVGARGAIHANGSVFVVGGATNQSGTVAYANTWIFT